MLNFFTPKISGFGIDLSDLSVKIVNLKKKRGKFFLTAFNRQEIKEGTIEEGEIKNEEALMEAIQKTLHEIKGQKIRNPYCIVSLPETESFVRLVTLPAMKPEEVTEAIKWELEANIPLSVQEIYYDWQIIDNLKPDAKQLDVLVGVLPKKTVDPYLEVLKKVGLKPFIFEIESLATARALVPGGTSGRPLAILDFGAKRTSFFIFSGQAVFFTTSLPIGNNSMVKTLSEKLAISEQKALEIKIKVGIDVKRPQGAVFEALRPAFTEMADKIKVFIDFYENQRPADESKNQINEVLLCGGGANLTGLDEFLSTQLKMTVRPGNPWVNITANPKETVGKLPLDDPLAYATALGLALRNFEK